LEKINHGVREASRVKLIFESYFFLGLLLNVKSLPKAVKLPYLESHKQITWILQFPRKVFTAHFGYSSNSNFILHALELPKQEY
jgi:hypothetical protein